MVGLLDVLDRHSSVGFDSAQFIYHIDGGSVFSHLAYVAFQRLLTSEFSGTTSTLTLTEVLVKPYEVGGARTAETWERLLRAIPNLQFVPVDETIARNAAELRSRYVLRTPDAVQLASAISRGSTAFVTNDSRLRKVGELQVILLSDFLEDAQPSASEGQSS